MTNDKMPDESVKAKDYIRKAPKRQDEIHTIDDIVDDLRYVTEGFPEAALKSALSKQFEIIPILLNLLDDVINRYESIEGFYFAHLHALYLLAKFREKQAFHRVIKIMSLPNKWPDNLLGDTITEDLHNIVASLYDGDIASLHVIIENSDIDTWSRNAALKTLLVLVKEKVLERSEVILYFKSLFNHPSFKDDYTATTHLVNASCDLYPDELQDQIEMAFDRGMVDDFAVDMKWVKSILSNTQEVALDKFLNGNTHYGLINDDDISSMKNWACFSKKIEKRIESDLEYHEPEKSSYHHAPVLTSLRTSPKIGRNEPCPCNSGKKFKKCCITTQ